MNTDSIIAGIDLQELAREIAMRMDPESLLDAEDVGAMLKCSARYVLEEYSRAPGFPKAMRLTGPAGRKSNPRWRRRDLTDWLQKHREGKTYRGGRPRRTD